MSIFGRKTIAVGALLALAQLSAFAGEIAVLRNGFSIHFKRKEQNGSITRLYTGKGFMDIASDQIESFAVDETPVVPDPPAAPVGTQSAAQPSTANQVVAPSPTAQAVNAVNIDQVVRDAASKNRLDPDFVSSVIRAESNFKTHAISKKGAQGLMQLMPGTAAQLGVADPFDPKANVEAGTSYLSSLLDLYHDDPIKALAAYNAGSFRVKQYNGVPPYRETRAYISKIVRDFNAKKRAQMKAAATTKTAARASTGTKVAAVPAKANRTPAKKKSQQASVTKTANPASL
ncbi:MAG TPA: lytic transglycosylase domain-containing protein [Candidatus Angelobacter sp.]|jgi:soluble lytic murein transglycosylase-like protein